MPITPFKIEAGGRFYRIVAADGTEGELVEYGVLAVIRAGGALYCAYLDPDDNEEPGEVKDPLEAAVYLLGAKQPTTVVDVEFDGLEDEEEEEEEEVGVEDPDDPDEEEDDGGEDEDDGVDAEDAGPDDFEEEEK